MRPAAVLLAAVAGLVAAGGTTPVRRRLRRLLGLASAPPGRAEAGGGWAGGRSASRRLAIAVVAGTGAVAVLGPGPGAIAGPLVAAVVHRRLRLADDSARRRRAGPLTAAAPLACDLLAATLAAGAPVTTALTVVAAAVGGPLGELLSDVAASMALGADPREAWAPVAAWPQLRPLASAAVRCAGSGAALAASLAALADDARQAAVSEAQIAARRAGVRMVGPLSACFLPAFVVLGIVPYLLGLVPTLAGSP